MSSGEETKRFSRLRELFWPVHRHELKKFLPMMCIFFLLSFDYNVLRCMKDTIVITAQDAGAEVIPFIKVWVMFPMSVALTYIFIRLSNRFSREQVFYCMLSIFLGYFLLFALFLYPAKEMLHAHKSAEWLKSMLPAGCKGLVAMYRYWIFTTFYVMAELWSNIVLFLLFWGFANQVTRLDEAKRFYGLFGLGTNFSGVASGQISIFVAQLPFYNSALLGSEPWQQSMNILIFLVLVAGSITIALFRYLNKHVLASEPENEMSVQKAKGPKKKFSMRENFRYLARSSYVLTIALIVIAYNLVINLVEVMWKNEVCALFPNPQEYNIYMNQITTIIGIMATFMAVVVSGNCLRKFGWTFTAMLTPVVLMITSIGFFGFFFMKDSPYLVTHLLGVAPLSLVVFFGSMQNCFSRACKYTVFDATKEMAFVPLSKEDKIKSKAAVDGVCNRLGKSGGSVIYNVLLVMCTSISQSAPFVAVFLFIAISLWIICVRVLGKKFNDLSTDTAPLDEKPYRTGQPAPATA
jgi:ATP:ADP antiporter, AAA family